MRKRRSIRTKLQAATVMLVLLSTLTLASVAIKSMLDSYITINANLRESLEQRYKDSIRYQVESLASLLEHYTQPIKNNEIPAKTQEEIKHIIRHAK